MLKITTVRTDRRCRLVVEGEIASSWVAELRKEWNSAARSESGLPVTVDLRNVVTISQEGRILLLDMMREGVKFICGGVLNRHILQELARKTSR